jgi:hypothetical protein
MKKVFVIVLSIALLFVAVGSMLLIPHRGGKAAAADNTNCTLIVPPNPLSAQGLATPWQLTATNIAQGPCHENNANQAVFVQAAIFDPATKSISIYDPLVIDQGTTPAITPTMPKLPPHATVGIWGGGDDNVTTLQHGRKHRMTLRGRGHCINGTPNSPFGQVFFCNAQEFFAAVNNAGGLTIPPLGTASDGKPCPTVRDFAIVDQDQSDNVTTSYLITADGRTAQNTAANKMALPGATKQINPSDNGLLARFVDPAIGCKPFTAPDLADGGTPIPAQPLNELQAAALQAVPQADVPAGDPMVLVNGNADLQKLNLYRRGVDQPQAATLADADTTTYCKNILNTAPGRLLANKTALLGGNAPVPAIASNLYNFLAVRLQVTLSADGGLNCVGLLNVPNPVVTTVTNGVVTSATINGM